MSLFFKRATSRPDSGLPAEDDEDDTWEAQPSTPSTSSRDSQGRMEKR